MLLISQAVIGITNSKWKKHTRDADKFGEEEKVFGAMFTKIGRMKDSKMGFAWIVSIDSLLAIM